VHTDASAESYSPEEHEARSEAVEKISALVKDPHYRTTESGKVGERDDGGQTLSRTRWAQSLAVMGGLH